MDGLKSEPRGGRGSSFGSEREVGGGTNFHDEGSLAIGG